MPPNFFLEKRKILNKLHGKCLLFLSYYVETYAHRIHDGPISSDILNNHDQWLQFMKNLNKTIQEKIIFRQGPFNDNWDFKQKFINSLCSLSDSTPSSNISPKIIDFVPFFSEKEFKADIMLVGLAL